MPSLPSGQKIDSVRGKESTLMTESTISLHEPDADLYHQINRHGREICQHMNDHKIRQKRRAKFEHKTGKEGKGRREENIFIQSHHHPQT